VDGSLIVCKSQNKPHFRLIYEFISALLGAYRLVYGSNVQSAAIIFLCGIRAKRFLIYVLIKTDEYFMNASLIHVQLKVLNYMVLIIRFLWEILQHTLTEF
jgi:hypothetical protein